MRAFARVMITLWLPYRVVIENQKKNHFQFLPWDQQSCKIHLRFAALTLEVDARNDTLHNAWLRSIDNATQRSDGHTHVSPFHREAARQSPVDAARNQAANTLSHNSPKPSNSCLRMLS